MKKFATFHLLIINENKYIDGACISVHTYRKHGNKNIEHNILIDQTISKQGIKKLERFFDRVIRINLVKNWPKKKNIGSYIPYIKTSFEINKLKSKKSIERYGKWINYSPSKWTILLFDEYKKVLFCDVDTLAVNDYTKVFLEETPAWVCFHKATLSLNNYANIIKSTKKGDKMDSTFLKRYIKYPVSDICKKNKNIDFIPVNASMVLLKPSIDDFYKIFNLMKKEIDKNGLYKSITDSSAPDENILFEYYVCKKKKNITILGPEYLVTEWIYKDKKKNNPYRNIKKPIIFNYDSTDKPWNKKEHELYEEEKIWFKLRKKLKL